MKRAFRARLDTPVACLFVVLVVISFFTIGRFAQIDFDPSAFIVAGDRFTRAAEVPRGIAVLKDSAGYDGQFYFRLALNPFTSKATEFGITLDNPPYRHQRILYPLIVHLASIGDADFVPIAMIAVNFLFFCLLAWISGALAQSLDRHALWGLLIVGFPGFLITYSRDLVEIVEAAFLLGSVLLMRRGRTRWATVALTLAVLTRETSLIAAVAAGIVFARDRLQGREKHRFDWTYFTVPIVAFCTLQLALFIVWGRIPVRAGNVVLAGASLTAFTSSWWSGLGSSLANRIVQIVALSFVVCSGAIIAYHLFLTRAAPTERLACILYGALLASVGALVWSEDIAFLRVYTQGYVFGAIVVLASRLNVATVLLSTLVLATWTVEFLRFVPVKPLLRTVFGSG